MKTPSNKITIKNKLSKIYYQNNKIWKMI